MQLDRTLPKDEYLKKLLDMQQFLIKYEKEGNFKEKRKRYGSKNYSNIDLKNEKWEKYPLDPQYLVSNKGRIKYKGIIEKQIDEINPITKEARGGYLKLENKKLRQTYIYTMVSETFLGKIEGDGFHTHHISNDGYDNSVANLILLTPVEHSIVHGFKIGEKINEKF